MCFIWAHAQICRYSPSSLSLLIAALIFSAGYYCARIFYNSKNLNCIGALSFFLRSVHTFSWFWSQIGVVILVTPKQEMERKSEWFCGVNFFRSNFKVEWENGVWTKIRFLDSGFLFTCGNFTLIFTVFSIFWIGFFLNSFPNPFTAHSGPSFLLESKLHISLVVFCSP